MAINNESETKYDYIASFKPLDPSINYTMLLNKGYASHVNETTSIKAYTVSISSLYGLGSYVLASDPEIN